MIYTHILVLLIGFVAGMLFTRRNASKVDSAVTKIETQLKK